MKSDQYKTLNSRSTGEYREKGSKFIAYAYPAYTESEWQEKLEEVKKLHSKARHHCYAYRLGMDKTQFRANDDGEPSGTAGRPILGQIDSFGLSNVIVIVIRYFGGTKLGTSGLKNAYKTSTKEALEDGDIILKTLEDIYHLQFDYSLMSKVMNAVKKLNLEIIEKDFSELGNLKIVIRQSELEETIKDLRSKISGIRIEEIDEVKVIPGLKMEFLFTR